MLDTSVHGTGERREPLRFAKELPHRLGVQTQYPECMRDMSAGDALKEGNLFIDDIKKLAPPEKHDAKHIVDTIPNNIAALGLIGMIAPNAPIIHCVREPVENGLACYFKRFMTGQPFAVELAKIGQFYRYYEALMDHWRAVLPNPWLEVRFENLIGNYQGTGKTILDFLNLQANHAALRQLPSPEGPVLTKAAVASYENFLGPLCEALTGDGQNTVKSTMAKQVTLQQALDMAAGHVKEGRLAEAEKLYRQLIAAAPQVAVLYVELGRFYFAQNQWRLAIEPLEKALELDPGLFAAHRDLGLVLMQVKKYPEATAHFEGALKLKPDDANVLYQMATLFFIQRDLNKAQIKARQALKIDSNHAAVHFLLGVIAEEESTLDDAIMHYQRAVELKPGFTQAKNNLGIAIRYQRKTDAELRALQEKISREPQNIAASQPFLTF